MNNEKTLPKAWKKIDENSEIAVASSGVSKVLYIQDIGEKTEGNGYIDKITGKLYLCKTTNEDVEVTDNFVLATTLNNASRLDNLVRNFYYYNEEIIDNDSEYFEFTKTSKTDLSLRLKKDCAIIVNAGARVIRGNVILKKNNTVVGISASALENTRAQIGISLNCNANDIINCTFGSAYDYQDEIMFGALAFITRF